MRSHQRWDNRKHGAVLAWYAPGCPDGQEGSNPDQPYPWQTTALRFVNVALFVAAVNQLLRVVDW